MRLYLLTHILRIVVSIAPFSPLMYSIVGLYDLLMIQAPWNEFRMNSVKYNGAYWRQGLEIWAQPAKIALAITLGSMLVIATKVRASIFINADITKMDLILLEIV